VKSHSRQHVAAGDSHGTATVNDMANFLDSIGKGAWDFDTAFASSTTPSK
jgi:hypothetical protein